MKTYQNYSLKDRNTFNLDVKAKEFVLIESPDDFSQIDLSGEHYVLGTGAATLFTKDYDGLIVSLASDEIKYEEDGNEVYATVPAGNEWPDFVDDAVSKNYWGVENLVSIPGSMGAAPVQNIGAYGLEFENIFMTLEAFDTKTGQIVTMGPEQCAFEYRSSIFKNQEIGRYIIISIDIRLHRDEEKVLPGYESLSDYLKDHNISKPKTRDIYNAVAAVRKSKLPDPKDLGNNGSFFKNPVVSSDVCEKLLVEYPDMPYWELKSGFKLSAGWLIEQTGWKGKRVGDVGVYEKHALILVNYGKGTGQDLFALQEKIKFDVLEKFGVELEPEVNIL